MSASSLIYGIITFAVVTLFGSAFVILPKVNSAKNKVDRIDQSLRKINASISTMNIDTEQLTSNEVELLKEAESAIENNKIDTTGKTGEGNALLLYSNHFGDIKDAFALEDSIEKSINGIKIKQLKKKNSQ